MRVNARLDEESQQQVDYLTRATGKPVSHVLRESVALYYRQVRSQRVGIKHLGALIAKGASGRADVASDAKTHLTDAIGAKHRAGVPPAPALTGTRQRTSARLSRSMPASSMHWSTAMTPGMSARWRLHPLSRKAGSRRGPC